jgi:Tfp pilus assembly protein PilN
MNPIRIDFAPGSLWHSILQIRAVAWGLAIIGLTLCIGAAATAYRLQQQSDALETRLQNIQSRLAARTRPLPTPHGAAIREEQARAVNEVIARLNLPWSDVFHSIESATPTSIALLALEPDATQHAIKGVAEAKTSDDMLAYIEQIGSQPFFESVELTKHEINELDTNRPLRFQFLAIWKRAGK